MLEFFKHNTILLLFLVIAIGYLVGKIRIKGFSLGVSAVLFVGLAFGSLHPDFKVPDIIYVIGLIFFVYTIGLQSGPSFFASLNRQGIAYNVSVAGILLLSSLITISFYYFVPGLQNGSILSGLYCGSLTNTPALATVVDTIKNMYPNLSGAQLDQKLSEPVIGYSVAYPFGVIGVILGFQLFKKLFSINLQEESEKIARTMGLGGEELENEDVLVSNPKIFGWLVREIFKAKDLKGLILSRIKHKNSENIEIVTGETVLEEGDILTMVAPRKILDEVTPIFGPRVDTRLHVQRDNLDYRRIVVSNPEVIGIPLGELDLHKKLQATITRVKRGDIDIIPTNETVLQAGDRIRVVASRKDLDTVGKFFGDSFQSIAHIDYISISIGIALGLLVGLIPIPMPGGTFHLGFAGGPLIVALILGKIGRTRGIVWTMSYNANLTLRQMGVVLFLAGIGLKAGYSFGKNVEAYGLVILISGMVVTFVNASLMMLIGLRVLKIPFPLLMGIISGMQTQPAVLAYSNDEVKNNAPNLGYAMVFPTAMIIKILLARIILKVLS